jgi:hypothetical protein
LSFGFASAQPQTNRHTQVSIRGEDFYINGQLTYAGRTWNGHRIEGLLLNARLVQGLFDDLNPETTNRWIYPDTGKWDAERNTREFITAMPEWREHGLLAFTVKKGSKRGRSRQTRKGVGPGKRVNELTLGGKEEGIACPRLSARYVNTRSPGPTPSLSLHIRKSSPKTTQKEPAHWVRIPA